MFHWSLGGYTSSFCANGNLAEAVEKGPIGKKAEHPNKVNQTNESTMIRLLYHYVVVPYMTFFHRTVSASEMEAFLTDNMPEHVKGVHMMIRAFDRNGDVKLNLYEFGDMIKAKEEGDIMARYTVAR